MERVIGSVEINRCTNLRSEGNTPLYQVDQSDSVYLHISSTQTEVVTSKSTQVNIITKDAEEETESPIPFQFITTFNKDTQKWKTVSADHVGA